MTPQGQFTVVAPIAADRLPPLRALLLSMNASPGVADPGNALLPFAQFPQLHFARFVILDDPTLADIEVYGVPRPRLPIYLAFMGDCDGAAADCLAEMVTRSPAGLRQIFGLCADFPPEGDLLAWLRAHDLPVAASYVNWVGRTVQQIQQESILQQVLSARVDRTPLESADDARTRWREMVNFVRTEVDKRRLTLTPAAPTPLSWLFAKWMNLVATLLVALLAAPFLLVLSPLLILRLRRLETSDPELCPRPSASLLLELQTLEDQDVTNQYTAFGSVKPGALRRWLTPAVFAVIQFTARHLFNRGYLGRVQTIHFARWVFVDGKRRVLFASNYDGGHQAYMDDFINKVAWGLNVAFSSGVGWPHTDFLLTRGARRESFFKYFQRRHQLPTQVWYKAYPGLTLCDMERNARIRQGLEQHDLSAAQALAWLKLL
ncbi:MAG: hypothetical protein JSR66_16225 [Proteobacteria bacterium]|nr:hypothetical protein [Pseudomonadota bacterium]